MVTSGESSGSSGSSGSGGNGGSGGSDPGGAGSGNGGNGRGGAGPVRVSVRLVVAGACRQLERLAVRNGRWRSVAFPAVVGVLRHPTAGVVLFDTGYTPRFFAETRHLPYSAYRRLLPVRCAPEQTVAAQLPGLGIDPGDVSLIVVSHFHADHIGGLGDFPSASFTYLRAGLDHVRQARGALGNLRNAFLPGHLPADFDARARPADRAPRVPVPDVDGYLGPGFDLLGDGSLIGVDLSGHVPGQLGLYLPHTQGPPVLLAGDACWHRRAFTDLDLPHPVVRLLTHDHRQYLARIGDLRRLAAARPDLVIVPSHCPASLAMARRALPG